MALAAAIKSVWWGKPRRRAGFTSASASILANSIPAAPSPHRRRQRPRPRAEGHRLPPEVRRQLEPAVGPGGEDRDEVSREQSARTILEFDPRKRKLAVPAPHPRLRRHGFKPLEQPPHRPAREPPHLEPRAPPARG